LLKWGLLSLLPEIILQLNREFVNRRKKYNRQTGVLKKLYSGTFLNNCYWISKPIPKFLNLMEMDAHKYYNDRLVKFLRNTCLPIIGTF